MTNLGDTLKLAMVAGALAFPVAMTPPILAQQTDAQQSETSETEMETLKAEPSADAAQDEGAGESGPWYTAEQAARGEGLYSQICSTCHGEDIISTFRNYPNAGLFHGFISTAMPANAPGSLPDQAYADIIAYLLSENGFPAGEEELPPDPEVLSQIDPGAAPTSTEGEDGAGAGEEGAGAEEGGMDAEPESGESAESEEEAPE